MIRLLEELLRVVAYGGSGALVGFLTSQRIADQHRLTDAVLTEAEKDMPSKRTRRDPLFSAMVLLAMIAMLLTAVLWMKTGLENAADLKRDCERSAALAETLRARTGNYLQGATAELEDARADLQWKRTLRNELLSLGAEPDSGFVTATERAIEAQERSIKAEANYLRHLQENPYPEASTEGC